MRYTEADFKFGLESEFILVNAQTLEPLWQPEIKFSKLNEIFESISLDGIESLEGLDLEKPHKRLMPYVVEGYHIPSQDSDALDMLPKGVEIRTPVCSSIHQCLEQHQILFKRLIEALKPHNYTLMACSHHPTESQFSGPQNKRRYDYWQWAMEVMTTYGPDFNIGLPPRLSHLLSSNDFARKINFYAPAMTALSVASPILDGQTWQKQGETGLSYRTYRRSVVAPPNENHPHEKDRIEFKVFDMPTGLEEYEAYFILFLTLVVSENLKGRSTNADRIYEMGTAAIFGLKNGELYEKVGELLKEAQQVCLDFGFSENALHILKMRYASRLTPADQMIKKFTEFDRSTVRFSQWLVNQTLSMKPIEL